jgi:hypothetical protein
MKLVCRPLASAVVALLVCVGRGEAQDGELWTFETGG